MKKEIAAFLHNMELKNRSPKAIKMYGSYLERFRGRVHIKSPLEITTDKVQKFQEILRREGLKPASVATALIIIRSFLKFLIRQDYIVLNPDKIEIPKVVRNMQSKVISVEEFNKVLEMAKADPMHYAILKLLASTGVRVSEMCSMKRDDLDNIVVRGKGDKSRPVFLSAAAKEAVNNYLATREDRTEYLFCVPGTNSQIHPRYVQRILKKYSRKTGVNIHPHQLRHYFATETLSNGADLVVVKELLGHSSISTTSIYVTITNERLREQHKKYSSML